jgi:hypothetical protein
MTSRPPAIRWIVAMAWLRVVACVIFVLVAIAAVSPARAEWMERVRQELVHRFGYSASAYSGGEAGEVVAGVLIPLALAALLLVFVHLRKLLALRIVAGLSVLYSLHTPGLLLTMLTLVLAFRASTRAYCQAEPPSPVQPATPA